MNCPLFLVPTAAPTEVILSVINATAINISWSPPPIANQSPPILSYQILVTATPFSSMIVMNITTNVSNPDTATRIYILTSLEEYNNYTIQIAAGNENGTGVFSSAMTIRTFEAGKT